jgi:raffinose synthase
MEDTNLARVSDDFYPTNPASWAAHIANCSFNTLFMGEVVVPDWGECSAVQCTSAEVCL